MALSPHREYLEYLQSALWQEKRRQAFRVYGRSCQRCGDDSSSELHVHQTYVRLFNEAVADLEVLCKDCHADRHGSGGW